MSSSPSKGWWPVLRQILRNTGASQTSLCAAGCAFYATLSLFPAVTALISVYGLVFDIHTAESQLHLIRNLIPASAYSLIVDRIHTLVQQPHSSLTLGLVFSLAITLWSATASSRSILSALNIAYHTEENRGFLRFQCLAFGTTFLGIIGACLTLALMVAAPAIVDYLPKYLGRFGIDLDKIPPSLHFLVDKGTPMMVHWLAPSLMLLFVFVAVTLLYRIAPCRDWTLWRLIVPGAGVATVLWVIASLGFSWYVSHFASYSATYGPLGAVAAIMMWLFVSAYVVLFGAVINAELEENARRKLSHAEAHRVTVEQSSGVEAH
ncbi:YihY family inner membrane protein [Saccharibacter sp. 17.LH.SD]|uniref:YihY/virulence factor BrkB family protein n=1 Tax=Saccharibacter sp. 17.LH.SD TaxID=2689393 RepID=UPI00136CEF88|nr:YihY/virulence factor BrkB family protein [Saccharibacter sp. 17.LH.SD]MXV43844.1 YihY family inner membrane protein [Saccharibacter sp. 17.LH.SD]